jgi:hypothetical protein
MFGNLLNMDRLRRIITVGASRARAFRKWYLEAGYTQAEIRGINLLKEWLSPEQLAQYQSYVILTLSAVKAASATAFVTVWR